jgi:pyridoxine 5'-phosphate synthase PdxJ
LFYSILFVKNSKTEFIVERKLILADAKNLKTLAVHYLHPEKPVDVVDATVFGRNYFGRASAPTEYDDDDNYTTTLSRVRDGRVVQDMEDERSAIMEELKELKTTADWFLHPEKPVDVVDATVFGRNYFGRASAPNEYDNADNFMTTLSRVRDGLDVQDMEDERNAIMEDLKQLKTTADWYLHPEKPIVLSDATACGRNYFTRPSAPTAYDNEDDYMTTLSRVRDGLDVQDMEDERNAIMEDLKQLKTTAEWYLSPEMPIVCDATACGRNYFTRPSAPTAYDNEDDYMTTLSRVRDGLDVQDMEDERNAIMEELKQLKTTADWYLHPEKPIVCDATACGRNYFTRPSAPEYDDDEEDDMEEERQRVLEEAAELKKVADWYLHPGKKVAVDSTVCGRNYFTRASAPEYDDNMEEEREHALADAELKKVAGWYFHSETKIDVDSIACGRNYFTRPSAPEYDDDDMEEERECVLAEAAELKMVADWYLHPEKKINVEPNVFGRNYFTRPSAPEEEDDGMEEERECVLAEAAELKMVADWYLHPEKKINVEPNVFGRNYFTRPSAPEEEDDGMEEERECVLAEAAELKKMADWCHNPNQPIVSDGFSTGRNYFTRLSAAEDDMDEERELVLAEAAELKQMADWCHNPNQPIVSDGFATARNYFTRPSAPEYEDEDDNIEEERSLVLAEAKELKEVASWYHEPSKPVKSNIAVTRNYFTRPSAPVEEDEEMVNILADALELKKLAIDYLHPEKPVVSSSINCIRNYFDRPSAKGHADYIHTEGHVNYPGDHTQEHFIMHADDYHHYDHYHQDDISHGSFQSHSDHFDMDEDAFHGFHESINAFRDSVTDVHDQPIPIIKEEDDGKEGHLSRSPSTIMLFEEVM